MDENQYDPKWEGITIVDLGMDVLKEPYCNADLRFARKLQKIHDGPSYRRFGWCDDVKRCLTGIANKYKLNEKDLLKEEGVKVSHNNLGGGTA